MTEHLSGGGASEPAVLRLAGEVDIRVAESVLQNGIALLERAGDRLLTVDLSDVTFIDATGLGALVGIRNHAIDTGQRVQVAGAQGAVKRMFHITGLDEAFGLFRPPQPASHDVGQAHSLRLDDRNEEVRMARVTEPLREEHRQLLPHVERLRTTADAVGDMPAQAFRQELDSAYAFLTEHLIPHATAEDRALYPVVARLMGAPAATATMERDHVAVVSLTEELGAVRGRLGTQAHAADLKALRRVLYGLYAVVSIHFAKEEETYLSLLDARLTAEEATDMFERMESAAAEAKTSRTA